MSLQDRLAVDPLGAACGCIVWAPIAVWVISMIHWMISGEVETLFGLIALVVAIGLGIVALNPPSPNLSPLILCAVIATVVLFPLARVAINRHALAAIDIEQLEKYCEALLARPDNAGALIRLAELLYIRGFPANAIALGDRALGALPENLFRAEHQMVGAWKLQASHRSYTLATTCLNCGHHNNPIHLHCQHCASPYIVDLARGKWLGRGAGKKLIAVWIGLIIAFVGIPASAQLSRSSPLLALSAIGVQVALGIVVVFLGFLRVAR